MKESNSCEYVNNRYFKNFFYFFFINFLLFVIFIREKKNKISKYNKNGLLVRSDFYNSNLSNSGSVKKEPESRLKSASAQGLASKRIFETLVEVAEIEPETPCAESPVSIKDSDFSPESLTEILTEISGPDRQMLTQVVQRWSSLSEEIKKAVLRVVE